MKTLWLIKLILLLLGVTSILTSCHKVPNILEDVPASSRSIEDCSLGIYKEKPIFTAEIVARRDDFERNSELSEYFKKVFHENHEINTILKDNEIYFGIVEVAPEEAISVEGYECSIETEKYECSVGNFLSILQPDGSRNIGATSRSRATAFYNAICRFFGRKG